MAQPETFYTLLLDGNLRQFALISLPKKGAINFTAIGKDRESLAAAVRQAMAESQVSPSQLVSVQVRQGKGAFSDTRSVALMANLIGHYAGVPIRDLGAGGRWQLTLKAAQALPKQGSIKPHYYAEPNITSPK